MSGAAAERGSGGAVVLELRPAAPREVVYLDELTLARAVLAGEPEALAALWDREASRVRRLVRRSLGPGDETEDFVQRVFLALLERLDAVRDPARLRSYLVSITLNTVRSELRRRRLRRLVGLSETGALPEIGVSPADARSRRALRSLYEILDELSADARLAFVLRYLEEMELTEVAEAMGWSLATTKRRIKRARELVVAKAQRHPELAAYVEGEDA